VICAFFQLVVVKTGAFFVEKSRQIIKTHLNSFTYINTFFSVTYLAMRRPATTLNNPNTQRA
jgi:hypothetical protein